MLNVGLTPLFTSQNLGTIYINADTAFARFPYKHTYVKLVPGNFALLNKECPGVFVNFDPVLKKYYATIGAGPDFGGVLADDAVLLISGVNRNTDVSKPVQINEKLPIVSGDAAIESLLNLNSGYGNNLNYMFFPDDKNDGYNSNSYTAGILAAGGLPEPPIIESIADDVPGFKKPVPSQDF